MDDRDVRMDVRFNVSFLFQSCRRERNEIVGGHLIGHEVGDSASAVGDEPAFFQDRDVQTRIQTLGARCRAHSCCIASDNNDTHGKK